MLLAKWTTGKMYPLCALVQTVAERNYWRPHVSEASFISATAPLSYRQVGTPLNHCSKTSLFVFFLCLQHCCSIIIISILIEGSSQYFLVCKNMKKKRRNIWEKQYDNLLHILQQNSREKNIMCPLVLSCELSFEQYNFLQVGQGNLKLYCGQRIIIGFTILMNFWHYTCIIIKLTV